MTDEETPKGTDYSTSKKKKKDELVPEKNIQKVVSGPVVVKKRNLGTKIKDLFVAADFRTVMRYVGYEVLVPAARNMVMDAGSKGLEKLMYGDSRYQRRPGIGQGIISRITYNAPVDRDRDREGWRDPRTRPPTSGLSLPRAGRPDFFLQTKQEAELILDEMYNILSVYEKVSVADLNGFAGLPSAHTDERWGWYDLRGTEVKQDRAGWWIDLPRPEAIQP